MTNTAQATPSEQRRPMTGLSNSAKADGRLKPPDENEIATRAYYLWEESGCPQGSAEADWFRAQEDLAPLPKPAERLT